MLPVGTKVRFKDRHCVGIEDAQLEWPTVYTVMGPREDYPSTFYLDAFWDEADEVWCWDDTDFDIVEEAVFDMKNISDLYVKTGEDEVVAGETRVYKASRRRNGEEQYVIRYNGTRGSSAVVKKKDLLSLAAALIELAGE